MKNKFVAFDEADMPFFEPTAKIGLLATINQMGMPHLTLITTLQAKTNRQIVWGQFTEGMSKQHVKSNPHTAFLIMTADRKLWRGKALYTHSMKEGEDYEMFNRKPMFRYNSYFGINTVHYMNLTETHGREALPLQTIIPASLVTQALKGFTKTGVHEPILSPWAVGLFNRPDSLKFVGFVDDDGFPTIIPLLQARAADSRRIVFSPLAYSDELARIPRNSSVAIFALSLQMEDVLVRGPFTGFEKKMFVSLGAVDIDWVYNSMPPKQGQIYPQEELFAVTRF